MAETTTLESGQHGHGHESTDVSVAGILFFVIGLAVFIVIVTAFLWLYFNRLAREQMRVKESRFPLAIADRAIEERLPPAPRLEGLDPESLMRSGVAGWPSQGKAQRERARQALASYGWADEKAGIAEIPIDRAIDLLAGKLPVRKDSANPARPSKDGREGKP